MAGSITTSTAKWKTLQSKLSLRSPQRRNAKRQARSLSPCHTKLDKIPRLLSNLPRELQAQVLCSLAWRDVLRFRMTCRLFSTLVRDHADELVRHLIKYDRALVKAHSLYRDDSSKPDFEYVVALSHRCHVAASLARFLAIYHLSEMFNYRTAAELSRSRDARLIGILATNLEPHLLIISHMLQTYRSSVAGLVRDIDTLHGEGALVAKTRAQARTKEAEILNGYNESEVCSTSMVFDLLKKTLFRELRPVSYATSWEWRLRGMSMCSASDQQVMELMVFGGLSGIKKVVTIPSYNRRLQELECWLTVLTPFETPKTSSLVGGKDETTLLVHRNFHHANDPVITARIIKILPYRSSFFDVWELIHLTKSKIGRFDAHSTRMERPDFLQLATSGSMSSDFSMRRR
ncbi:MAG: hypothetical protein L6R35_006991 [Caloplaca aegaea]|nr:MAG: hypothetical protein L6R35_006991 [Caloplaca aegaea]